MTKGTHSYLEDDRNKSIKIYVNGKILSRADASISVFDSGFLLGDGIWEGIRLLNGELVSLDEHLERLFFGAKQLDINIGLSNKELIKIIHKTTFYIHCHSRRNIIPKTKHTRVAKPV